MLKYSCQRKLPSLTACIAKSPLLIQIIIASEVIVKYGNSKREASHFNSSFDFLFGIMFNMTVMMYINYDVRQRDKSWQDVKTGARDRRIRGVRRTISQRGQTHFTDVRFGPRGRMMDSWEERYALWFSRSQQHRLVKHIITALDVTRPRDTVTMWRSCRNVMREN